MTPRVLVVEPHPDVRKLLELSTGRLGYEPVSLEKLGAALRDACGC